MKIQWIMLLGAPCMHNLKALYLIVHVNEPVLLKGSAATNAKKDQKHFSRVNQLFCWEY